MKKILLPLLLLAASIAFAAEPAKPAEKSALQGITDRISIDVAGALNSGDLDTATYFGDVALNVAVTEHFGAMLEVNADEFKGTLLDRMSASVTYNIVEWKKSTLYAIGGAWYDFEQSHGAAEDLWGIHFGGGVEYRISKPLGLFTEVRMVKPLSGEDTSPSAFPRVGICIHF